MALDGTEYFECTCDSAEHVLRVIRDLEEKEVYFDLYLNKNKPWYERALLAIKYTFGYTSKFGNWECTALDKKEAIKLRGFLNKFIKDVDNSETTKI